MNERGRGRAREEEDGGHIHRQLSGHHLVHSSALGL